MPPQQTNGASDTGSAAERLRLLDLSIPTRLLKRSSRALMAWWRRLGSHVRLQDLGDRDLADIGLTRDEIERLSPDRAVDRIRTRAADLWSRGGM